MTAFTRAALIAEARTWIGTPWHHQAAVKGAGCDCIGFVRGVAEPFIGAITQPMNYAATWPLYRAEERLRDEMAAHAGEIDISMDGKGAWRDNVFVERLWRSIKYEEVYLHAYKTVSETRAGIGRYLTFYNSRRPHSSLDRQTPDQAYFNPLTPMMAAA